MNKLHGFILHAYTKPEKSDAFLALFSQYVEQSREEDGCIEYHMLRDRENPALFIFYEVWQSKAHLDVHSSLPHMARFFENRMYYLERDFEIRLIDMISSSSASH